MVALRVRFTIVLRDVVGNDFTLPKVSTKIIAFLFHRMFPVSRHREMVAIYPRVANVCHRTYATTRFLPPTRQKTSRTRQPSTRPYLGDNVTPIVGVEFFHLCTRRANQHVRTNKLWRILQLPSNRQGRKGVIRQGAPSVCLPYLAVTRHRPIVASDYVNYSRVTCKGHFRSSGTSVILCVNSNGATCDVYRVLCSRLTSVLP